MPVNLKKIFTPDQGRFTVNRVEALSDGVFSITMTILVLEIRIPHVEGSEHGSIGQLLKLLPVFENYIISFLVLGLFWIRHQMQFKVIREADRNLMWINIFFLMFIAVVPFTTSLLFEFSDNRLSVVIYCANLIVIGLLVLIHWRYAITGHRLVDKSLDMNALKKITMIHAVTPAMFMAAIVIAFFDIRLAKMSLFFLPLGFSIVFKIYKRLHPNAIGKDL